jgi:SAM-dependent methyltransferase
MDRRDHWEGVYRTKRPDEVSWFQPRAELSRELVREVVPDVEAPILDVGGGASTLAGDLLADGYRDLTVLDLASAAMDAERTRLGAAGRRIRWVVGDALDAPFGAGAVALWHDRASFHFLTDPGDRDRYVAEVRRVVRPGGYVLVATFAADGPTRCSGLPVARYAPEELDAAFGRGFEPLTWRREVHHTPSGAEQPFTYRVYRCGAARP